MEFEAAQIASICINMLRWHGLPMAALEAARKEEWKGCAVCTGYNTRLRQAIESEPDRQAYLAQIEKWGAAYEEGDEPKEERCPGGKQS